MLREIRIQNLGVIDDAVLELSTGLNVVTGETGAGKTMVVSGLGLLLGARADAGLVRTGARRTVVEGVVEVGPEHPASLRAIEAGGAASRSSTASFWTASPVTLLRSPWGDTSPCMTSSTRLLRSWAICEDWPASGHARSTCSGQASMRSRP